MNLLRQSKQIRLCFIQVAARFVADMSSQFRRLRPFNCQRVVGYCVRVPMSYRQIVKRYDAAEILMLTTGVILVVAIVFAIQ